METTRESEEEGTDPKREKGTNAVTAGAGRETEAGETTYMATM